MRRPTEGSAPTARLRLRSRSGTLAAAAACLFASIASSGCSSDATLEAGAQAQAASGETRVERCVDRLFARSEPDAIEAAGAESVRGYIEATYCRRFESRGWIYDDGTLTIDAHLWATESGRSGCQVATADGRSEDVPCEQLEGASSPVVLDCAVLHHVRRAEAQRFVEQLATERDVRCADGTPLADLGAR